MMVSSDKYFSDRCIVDMIEHFSISSPLLSGFFSFWDIPVIGQRYQEVACVNLCISCRDGVG